MKHVYYIVVVWIFLLQSCHSADKVRAQLEEPLKLEILKKIGRASCRERV